jgi:hypothetical protein
MSALLLWPLALCELAPRIAAHLLAAALRPLTAPPSRRTRTP